MRGVIQAVTFPADWYLDHRRPEWSPDERRGWIRYCPKDELVYVHDHAVHIIDVLTWTRRSGVVTEARR